MAEEKKSYLREYVLVDLFVNKIKEIAQKTEYNKDHFKLLGNALEVLFDQIPELLRGLEKALDDKLVGDPKQTLSKVEYEEANFRDDVEAKMEELIKDVLKAMSSLGSLLTQGNYKPHSRYRKKGILVKENRNTGIPAIQISFIPLDLDNFNTVDTETLGVTETALLDYLNKHNQGRNGAEITAENNVATAKQISLEWQNDVAKASARNLCPGFKIRLGRVGQNGMEPMLPNNIIFDIQIRYSPELGIHFVPVLQYENKEIRERNLDIYSVGKATSIQIPYQTTQQNVNNFGESEINNLT